MAALLQITCIVLLISLAQSSSHPSRRTYDSINKNLTSISMLEDINKMMATMHERFQRLLNSPLGSDWSNDHQQLDALEPNCTTKLHSPRASISSGKVRRKKLRQTQTTICTKELILDGTKQFFKEVNITDDKGVLISHSKIYRTISINTNNGTLPLNNNVADKNVIAY